MLNWKLIFILFYFSAISVYSYSQLITTIGGNGNNGIMGDSGLAVNAQIHWPSYVCIDKHGDVYISEYSENKIRKINSETGIITTFVGTGIAGFSGDSGLASIAQVNWPYGVNIDSFGNLFFADANNNRIRKVDVVTGIITTIAGINSAGFSGDSVLAINTALSGPTDVIIDNHGNIIVADANNNRIRKIDATTGIITTIAGNGVAGFSGDNGQAKLANIDYPVALGKDSVGNIYFSDFNNGRIRKVTTSGIINTIAGNGVWGYNGDSILATNAQLNYPKGITCDLYGNVYIGDQHNHRVRKVDAITGVITTVVGTGIGGYNGDLIVANSAKIYNPAGVKLDNCGNLYIADLSNNRIRKVWFNTDTLPHAAAVITPNDTVSTGTQVTTTASVNTGTIVSCQWIKNGVATSTTTNSYTYTPANGDSLYCIVTTRACTGRTYTDTTLVLHITVTGDAGVANTTSHTIQTHPNPVTDVLHVATTEALNYVLHSLMGVTLLQGSVDKQNSIDMKAIPSGIYLLQLTNTQGQREVLRVVKE